MQIIKNQVLQVVALMMVGVSSISPAADNNVTDTINFKATVDATTIRIQDGKMWLQNGPFDKPTKISIMGRKWELKWEGEKTEVFADFKKPLKSLQNSTVKVDVLRGRSIVKINEQPSAANQWTAIIEIRDIPNDADEYALRISW